MNNDYEATKPMTTDAVPVYGDTPTETLSNDDVISKLNTLIEICKDGQDGFKTASEGIERSELKTTFYEFSQQRSEFSGVLQELVRSLGGDPEKSGSFSAAVHRGWIDIKSAVTGKAKKPSLTNVNAAKITPKRHTLMRFKRSCRPMSPMSSANNRTPSSRHTIASNRSATPRPPSRQRRQIDPIKPI